MAAKMRERIPLTVRCSCGATGRVRYGAPWLCTSCGTGWRTDAGQDQEYRRFLGALRKIRLLAAGGAVVIGGTCIVLSFIIGTEVLLSGLLALGLYYIVVLPLYRKQLRALYVGLPQWRLSRIEPGEGT
jgi:hypothetical protein